ncbi:hypothetical protein HDC34_001785 [Pseudoclavibacter sp. JAI123]|uniref:hypothetical protein n=1 Tax=Pseudoclavibacter sp. JAI123 TaxID=2723065 RepID=UPI0015C863FB|nr:hypothetical protein [Pseudoclavibacter sp. JAI123]NYF13491.1 hypothetical protein [Pseudoclavibacter sp. JAI123]
MTFTDRIGRFDGPVEDPDVVRVQDFAISDTDHVDLVEKLDEDIEQIKDTAAEKHRKLTKAEQNKLTTLEAERATLREHAEIALSAMEHQAMSADFNREYQLSISKVDLSVGEAKDIHLEAMDRARAAAHATIDLCRQDLAAYAEDYRLDKVDHVEVHTRAADAFEEEHENRYINRIFDRDGEGVYYYATGRRATTCTSSRSSPSRASTTRTRRRTMRTCFRCRSSPATPPPLASTRSTLPRDCRHRPGRPGSCRCGTRVPTRPASFSSMPELIASLD